MSKRFVVNPTISVPTYIESDPAFWFVLLEDEFLRKDFTEDASKYTLLIKFLPTEILLQMKDVIKAAPQGQKYALVKEAIISRTAPSELSRVQKLLGSLQLGDRKPSALLNEMRDCLGTATMDESLLREMWIQRLPEDAQNVLTFAKSSPLSEVASMADELLERRRSKSTLNAVNQSIPGTSTQTLESLAAQVAELQQSILQLSCSNGRNRPQSHRRSATARRRSPSSNGRPICRIHRKYGDNARNCIKPCFYRQHQAGNARAGV